MDVDIKSFFIISDAYYELCSHTGNNDPLIQYRYLNLFDTPISDRLIYEKTYLGMRWSDLRKMDPAVLLYESSVYQCCTIEEYAIYLTNLYRKPYLIDGSDKISQYISKVYHCDSLNILTFIMNFYQIVKTHKVKSAINDQSRC
jgi:hypothetical protein